MLEWLKHIWLGLCLFTPLAFSGVWKRVLILSLSILLGFAGPILALPRLPALNGGDGWFWDALATEAYEQGEYKDVILAAIPTGFVCFTDFMNHVLDDEFRYLDSRVAYNGIFTILAFLVLAVAALPFSFAALSSAKQTWIAQFDYSWSLAKLVLIGAFVFEMALGCVEALRQARRELNARRSLAPPNVPTESGSGQEELL
jgi:hypothetical protein